jgi:hypothetical protein
MNTFFIINISLTPNIGTMDIFLNVFINNHKNISNNVGNMLFSWGFSMNYILEHNLVDKSIDSLIFLILLMYSIEVADFTNQMKLQLYKFFSEYLFMVLGM